MLLFTLSSVGIAANHDYDYDYEAMYKIYEHEGTWKAESVEIISHVFRSESSIKTTHFSESAAFYNWITDFEAELNEDGIDDGLFTFSRPNYRDVFLNDYGVWSFSLPHALRKGDSIRYRVDRHWGDITYLNFIDVPNYNRVRSFKITFEHPTELKVLFTEIAARSNPHGTIEHPDENTTVISYRELEFLPSLNGFAHNWVHSFIGVEILKDSRSLTNEKPIDYCRWYLNQFSQKCDLNDSLRSIVLKNLEGASSRLDTLRVLHDYTRSTIRYVADERSQGAFFPRAPSLTVSRGYGDCKDRAHLVVSLARSLGIQAWLALIHTETAPTGVDDIHQALFNHVIVAAVNGTDTIFFDPTARFSEISQLPRYDADKRTLLIDSVDGRWAWTRQTTSSPDINVVIRGSLSDPTNAQTRVELRGTQAQFMRYQISTLSKDDLEKEISSDIGSELTKIKLSDAVITDASDTLVVISSKADISSCIISGSKKRYVPAFPLQYVQAGLSKRSEDSQPITGDFSGHVRLELQLDVGALQFRDTSIVVGQLPSLSASYNSELIEGTTRKFVSEYKIDQHVFEREDKRKFLEHIADINRFKKEFHVSVEP